MRASVAAGVLREKIKTHKRFEKKFSFPIRTVQNGADLFFKQPLDKRTDI